MNKDKLIEKIQCLDKLHGTYRDYVDVYAVLELVKLLDEPEKVKVSEEEAKFLKTFDFNCGSDVTTALYHVSRTGWGYYLKDNDGIELKDLSEGFRELENRKRLIKAILDGYEVEKEKRYIVKLKNNTKEVDYLVDTTNNGFRFYSTIYTKYRAHTKKELEEAGFGWVFSCEGIEIEEVK